MSQIVENAGKQARLLRIGAAVPVFTIAVGLSAFLLFSIQPMFTKIVLPQLGGSPGVWSVAMVFFQAMLLAGYGYAHLLTTRLTPRHAALTHVGVMIVVLFVALPIGLTTALGKPPAEAATFWLLGAFALSVGLPFFVVSAHGPLLQAWFARTGHAGAQDPYFLYAASNVGSLVALLSFPFLVEPLLSTKAQTSVWSFGFALLIAAVAMCCAFLPNSAAAGPAGAANSESQARTAAPTLRMRLTWCLLAFVPSGLLVAVTAHISTDVAAAPLLWVIPLSLFLLTFIITFQPRPWLSHKAMLTVQPALIVATLAFGSMLVTANVALALIITLAAFFVSAMVFHGEMVRLRPAAEHLTSFYVWMSVGGVLGGIFTGLIAPHVFNTLFEYGLLFVAALLIRLKDTPVPSRNALLASGAMVVGGVLAVFVVLSLTTMPNLKLDQALTLGAGAAAMLGLLAVIRDAKMAAAVFTPIMLLLSIGPYLKNDQISVRSFFGVSKIFTSPDGTMRHLAHGTTLHGTQRIDQIGTGQRPDPLTYYYDGGPFDQAIVATRAAKGGKLGNVAVVGLGTGSQACLKQPGESWTFYEIDPYVVRIAQDPSLFTFMSVCAPQARVVLGDARLMLQDAPKGHYDLIIVDAFSSDSIPLHLLTREAMELYQSRLTPGGAVVFHLSNRNLTIAPFAASTAATLSLQTWRSMKQTLSAADARAGKASTDIALVTGNPAVVTALKGADADGRWSNITPAPGDTSIRPWTDDFSNILKAAWLKFNENLQARP
jgi:hypothetical protein